MERENQQERCLEKLYESMLYYIFTHVPALVYACMHACTHAYMHAQVSYMKHNISTCGFRLPNKKSCLSAVGYRPSIF